MAFHNISNTLWALATMHAGEGGGGEGGGHSSCEPQYRTQWESCVMVLAQRAEAVAERFDAQVCSAREYMSVCVRERECMCV